MPYYEEPLARIHHEAYGQFADLVAPGVLERLGDPKSVLELGAGSGALTRHLLRAGHQVVSTDASPAMVELASRHVPEAKPRILELPDDPIPEADVIVAVGHVFNYLDNEGDVTAALLAAGRALRPGGLLLTDLLDLSYGETRSQPTEHRVEGDGWVMTTHLDLQSSTRFVRTMTIETVEGVTQEVHTNVLVNVEELAQNLDSEGFPTSVSDSFGSETLPPGFRVLEARRLI